MNQIPRMLPIFHTFRVYTTQVLLNPIFLHNLYKHNQFSHKHNKSSNKHNHPITRWTKRAFCSCLTHHCNQQIRQTRNHTKNKWVQITTFLFLDWEHQQQFLHMGTLLHFHNRHNFPLHQHLRMAMEIPLTKPHFNQIMGPKFRTTECRLQTMDHKFQTTDNKSPIMEHKLFPLTTITEIGAQLNQTNSSRNYFIGNKRREHSICMYNKLF
mmetsp:Transcript_15603/g.21753  ORF Transcript_15603/g.21753 Transcript_15603/m.21753 type:complete len:211 (+) Transcript_15603:512-1144(+)